MENAKWGKSYMAYTAFHKCSWKYWPGNHRLWCSVCKTLRLTSHQGHSHIFSRQQKFTSAQNFNSIIIYTGLLYTTNECCFLLCTYSTHAPELEVFPFLNIPDLGMHRFMRPPTVSAFGMVALPASTPVNFEYVKALVLTLSLDVQHVKPSDPFVSKILQLWSSEHGGRHACKGVVTVFFAGEVQLMLTGKHLSFPEQGLLELHALSPVVVVLDPSDWLSLESESPPVVSLLVAVAEAVMSENGMNRLVEFATGGSFEAVPFPVLE